MPPASVLALGIVILVIVPGSMYTWAFERQSSGYGVTLADRTLRFLAVSLLFHLIVAWPEYWLFRFVQRPDPASGQFAAAWAGVLALVALPALVGTTLGGLYATRSTRSGWAFVRRWLPPERETALLKLALGRDPAPRAWDDIFSERPNVYLRVRLTDDSWIAGRFADRSYAGGFPHDTDLHLEEAWEILPDGTLGDRGLGYAVYVPASAISMIEIMTPSDEEITDAAA